MGTRAPQVSLMHLYEHGTGTLHGHQWCCIGASMAQAQVACVQVLHEHPCCISTVLHECQHGTDVLHERQRCTDVLHGCSVA